MFKYLRGRRRIPPLDPQSTLGQLLHNQAFGAVLLLFAAGLALFCANLEVEWAGRTVSEWYAWLWEIDLGFHVVDRQVAQSLHVWVNDGLMAIFFFLVGLEIKRELLVGELTSTRKAALPIAAAAGGMVFPAVIFSLINFGREGSNGWGIPMATDIAFAGGVIGLLGRRIPAALAVFLIALAIVDDLGAVAVIAVFYTSSIDAVSLEAGLACILTSFLLAWIGFRNTWLFTLIAVITWFCFLRSGVHATVAGVLFAFTIPVDASYETPLFIERLRKLLTRFDAVEDHVNPRMVNSRQQRIVRTIEMECVHVESPLQRMEYKLHPWIVFVVMPVFAFANAGVHVDFSTIGTVLREPVTLGVVFGLLVGKQIGIMLFSAIAVKLNIAELPDGVKWSQIYGVSWLAGIGFTMSLFIGQLAYGSAGHGTGAESGVGATHDFLTEAKMGVLAASLIAAVVGTAILWWTTRKHVPDPDPDRDLRVH